MKMLMMHIVMRDSGIPVNPFVFRKSFWKYFKSQVTNNISYDHVGKEHEYGNRV